MSTKELVVNLIDELDDSQLQQIFSFAKFLKAESSGLLNFPNIETLEAIREVEEMTKNPSIYKKYSNFNEILEEVIREDV